MELIRAARDKSKYHFLLLILPAAYSLSHMPINSPLIFFCHPPKLRGNLHQPINPSACHPCGFNVLPFLILGGHGDLYLCHLLNEASYCSVTSSACSSRLLTVFNQFLNFTKVQHFRLAFIFQFSIYKALCYIKLFLNLSCYLQSFVHMWTWPHPNCTLEIIIYFLNYLSKIHNFTLLNTELHLLSLPGGRSLT